MKKDEPRPAPGSRLARAIGCTCPRADNHSGSGYGVDDNGNRLFVLHRDCPLHGSGRGNELHVSTMPT